MAYLRFMTDTITSSGSTYPRNIPRGGIVRAAMNIREDTPDAAAAARAALYMRDDRGAVVPLGTLNDELGGSITVIDLPPVPMPPGCTYWFKVIAENCAVDLSVAYLSEA